MIHFGHMLLVGVRCSVEMCSDHDKEGEKTETSAVSGCQLFGVRTIWNLQ